MPVLVFIMTSYREPFKSEIPDDIRNYLFGENISCYIFLPSLGGRMMQVHTFAVSLILSENQIPVLLDQVQFWLDQGFGRIF